jgi:hypothetical protein
MDEANLKALVDEANARCQKGDHSWFNDELLLDLAYRILPCYEYGSEGVPSKRHREKVCLFCGYRLPEYII